MSLFGLFKKKDKKDQITIPKGDFVSFDVNAQNKPYIKTSDSFAFSITTTLPPKELTYDPKNVIVKLENDRLNVYIDDNYVGTANNQAKTKFVDHCTKKWSVNALTIYENGRTRIKIKYDL